MISLNSCSCPILSISILPIALRKEGRKRGRRKAGRLGGKKKGREGGRMKRRKEGRKKGRKQERMKETLLVKPLLMTRHEPSSCIPWGLWEASFNSEMHSPDSCGCSIGGGRCWGSVCCAREHVSIKTCHTTQQRTAGHTHRGNQN